MIYFKAGYKYHLFKTYTIDTGITSEKGAQSQWIDLTPEGLLTIKAGYAWDGPSGPTFDTKNFMRGSLVHDALYQLMRQRFLPGGNTPTREKIDRLLQRHCREDGMSKMRAWWVFKGVHYGARKSSTYAQRRKVFSAPTEQNGNE